MNVLETDRREKSKEGGRKGERTEGSRGMRKRENFFVEDLIKQLR